MKKIFKLGLLSLATTSMLYGQQTAISYMQNANKAVVLKNLVDKITNINNSIGLYVVNTGGNPTYDTTADKLSFGFTKETMYEYSNLYADDLTRMDGNTCTLSTVAGYINYCSNTDSAGVTYNYIYNSTNKIPIGIEFNPSTILGTTTLNIDSKIIAYLNSKGIVMKDNKFVKYFSEKTLSIIKQEYYITKENSDITFNDVTLRDLTDPTVASSYTDGDVVYSPDGKGGFLIYMIATDGSGNKFWQIIGEPKIALIVNSVSDLEDIKLSIGEDITVLDDGGVAIVYTMQDTVLDGEGNAAASWNKNTGNYEKNYYFSPIKISDISLGVSAELKKALGNWDSHTKLKDTYIDSILYDPKWQSQVDRNGNKIIATSDYTITYGENDAYTVYVKTGDYKPLVDAGGNPIMKSQVLNTIIGHVKYLNGSYKKLYFGISASEFYTSGLVKWIGFNHTGLSGSDVWIYHGGSGKSYTSRKKYDTTYLKKYSRHKNNIGVKHSWNYNYLNSGLNIYENIACKVTNDSCNTSYACHHNTSMCVYMNKSSVTNKLASSEFNMKLGCHDTARITYNDGKGSMVLLDEGEKMLVNVLPVWDAEISGYAHKLTYDLNGNGVIGDNFDKSFVNKEFDITEIDASTFGDLRCIKRNAASNYGVNQ